MSVVLKSSSKSSTAKKSLSPSKSSSSKITSNLSSGETSKSKKDSIVGSTAVTGKPKWNLNDEQKMALLKHVLKIGAHISVYGRTRLSKFGEVNRELFTEECMVGDKTEHFRDDEAGARKILNKYNAIMKETKKLMMSNLSAAKFIFF